MEKSLIITIVNKGNHDLVLIAARNAGAKGGTITTARGTQNPDVARRYGINIQPEKEMIYMVVDNNIKDKVMNAIYSEAGLKSQGAGITFSLPIIDAIGLNPFEEENEESENTKKEK